MQPGSGAHCAQPADSARVPAIHFVQAVTQAELVGSIHVVVDPGEEVIGTDRIWVQPRRQQGSPVAGALQTAIDSSNARGCDGNNAVLVQLLSLEVGEIEGAVAKDRSAKACSVLRLGERQLALRKSIAGVEPLIAKETIGAPAKGVGSALRHHVDVAAESTAKLGLPTQRDHLELTNDIQPIERTRQSCGII